MLLVSFVASLVLAGLAARPFVYQTPSGWGEATPITMAVFVLVFVVVLISSSVGGLLLVYLYTRRKPNKPGR